MIELPPSGDTFQLTIQAVEGGDAFTFPIEPNLSVRRRNRVIRKYPQKGKKGTIKERWMTDDFDVTIQAVMIGEAEYLKDLQKQITTATPEAEKAEENTLLVVARQRLLGEVDRVKNFASALVPAQVAGALGATQRAGDADQPEQLSPTYPFDTLATLLDLCSKGYLKVQGNKQLNKFNITHLVVYDVSLPFTAGEYNQEVIIKCYSDEEDD